MVQKKNKKTTKQVESLNTGLDEKFEELKKSLAEQQEKTASKGNTIQIVRLVTDLVQWGLEFLSD